MKFFDLDQQISNIGLKAVGIGDNQTVEGGLIGWLYGGGHLGSGAITNSYVDGILPDLYILFYAVAMFVLVMGILVYMGYSVGIVSSQSYALLIEVVKRVGLGAIAVGSATWILGWIVDLSDALTLMFGLNADIMAFVVDMFTSVYCCIFVLLGAMGIYATATIYIARGVFLGCLEVCFIIAVTMWIFGAIELSICRSVEGLGVLLFRFMLWGVFVAPLLAICYGIGMGAMMSSAGPEPVMMFMGIMILLFACVVPLIVFLKFVYNPISPIKRVVGSVL